ncbi:hypothetical protein [Ulvibacter litoralis]|uniref:Uncharacterized protein n=1 Tax=Ulvibacter litoralis TaxID=227084 RepID=A0A1G7GQ26_9FLAO|nr:hypothetical protein [Ulvibacter litoralis]GHC55469.1 hypothetical protein GCM10008083_19530 [Ulvibacter litoralis]SDE90237.1 hypothetical protein SAMN05421855_103270 [Ulvibacter litoralis]
MPTKTILLLLLLAFISKISIAQHIDIDKKALAFLASEENVNVVFSFEGTEFYEDPITEEAFLKQQFDKVSERKDETVAAQWVSTYQTSKKEAWPRLFIETLNERTANYKNHPTFSSNNPSAKYTMKINTVWMYFGYNVVIGKVPAKVSMDVSFYETATPTTVLFNTTIKRAMGINNKSYDLSNWPSFKRVGKAYVKGAYKLSQALKRVLD